MRITESKLANLVNETNKILRGLGKNWHLVYYPTNGHQDIKRQKNGETTTNNITPDCASTTREIYIWLRGFITGISHG